MNNGVYMPERLSLVVAMVILVSCHSRKTDELAPLEIASVEVAGEIGRRIDMTIEKNLMDLDIDSIFLRHCRFQHDTPKVRDGFCGIGMFVDGLVSFAAYKKEPALIQLKNKVVDELIRTQDTSGYIGLYTPRMRKTGWDTHESAYIILGLVNDYKYFHQLKSIDAAVKLADNMLRNNDKYICGFEPALIDLYRVTSDRKYLDYIVDTLGLMSFKGGSEHHSTHVYGYLARAYAQLLLHDIEQDPILLQRSKAAIENMTTFHAMDISGTIGSWEHWNNSQEGISDCGETCASAYAIRMLDKLLQKEGNSFYGDIMERIIYNALFAAQSPDGRKIRYFTPFEDERLYYPDDYFCCPNNFRRIIAELPSYIYYQSDKNVYINLYTDSKATLSIRHNNVTLTQKTDYPTSGEIKVYVSTPGKRTFAIYLRIPSWCENAKVKINGEAYTCKLKQGHFAEIKRKWGNNDVITLDMPMNWRFIRGTMAQYNRAALMRGPVVYCLSNKQNQGLLDAENHHEKIIICPETISMAVSDSSFRPHGTQASVMVHSINGKRLKNQRLVFTEFINPDGIKTYFDLPDSVYLRITTEDEFMLKDEL